MAGWTFLLILLLLLFAAWNTASNLLYVLVGGMASFLILSSALSRWNLRRIVVRRDAPASVHRLDPFTVVVGLENRKRVMPAVSVRIESVETGQPTVGFTPVIPGKRVATMRVTQRCERRGVHLLPELELFSQYPFGLGDVRRRFRDTTEVVVYPRVLPLRAQLRDFVAMNGQIPAPVQDDTNEYFSLREYIIGDDVRRIAWKASARFRTWLVREHQREISREVLIEFDTHVPEGGTVTDDEFEESVELVASLGAALMERHFYVAIATPNGGVALGTGKGHLVRMLEFLARVQPIPVAHGATASGTYYEAPPGRVVLHVAADPSRWGSHAAGARNPVLNPREVVNA